MAQRRVAHQREGAPVVLDLRLRGRVALGRKAMAMAVQPDLDAGCLQLACLLQSHEGAEALRFYRRGIDVEGRAETAKQRLARLGALQGFGVFIKAMPRRRPLRLVSQVVAPADPVSDLGKVKQPAASPPQHIAGGHVERSEEHTSELQSLMPLLYAVF